MYSFFVSLDKTFNIIMKLLDLKCNFTMRFGTNKAIFFLGNKEHEGYVLTRNSYFNCDAFWLSWESCQQVFCSGIIRKCVWEKSALVKFFSNSLPKAQTHTHTPLVVKKVSDAGIQKLRTSPYQMALYRGTYRIFDIYCYNV